MARVLTMTTAAICSSLSRNTACPLDTPSGLSSALKRARELSKHLPEKGNTSTTHGEEELASWWVEQDALLQQARAEWGPLHSALYDLEKNEELFIMPEIRTAISALESAALSGTQVNESVLWNLLRKTDAPSVWSLPFFTPLFCTMVIEELQHHEASGIPLRRPNGMNRYGAILDQLGFEESMTYLSRRYLRPLGQMLFPWLIARGDADEHYAFVVRYKLGEDVELAEHADASVLTLNANLGLPTSQGGFKAGALAFKGTRFVDKDPRAVPARLVQFDRMQPGEAILHLGGQYHAALPIESGERINLVVWLHGKHEVVRVAPHPLGDRLSPVERWTCYEHEQMGKHLHSQ